MCGCRQEKAIVKIDDSGTATSSEVTVPEIVIYDTVPVLNNNEFDFRTVRENEYDERINQLFKAFNDYDKEVLMNLTGAKTVSVFDFIDNIKFTGYETIKTEIIEGSNETDFSKRYTVNVFVEESSDPRFPEGKNVFEITALNAVEGSLFSPLSKYGEEDKVKFTDMLNGNDISDNARMCYFLTVELEPFFGRSSCDYFTVPDNEQIEFYGSMSRFLGKFISESTVNNYNNAAKNIFGIDFEFNEENINPLWLGSFYKEAVLVSEADNEAVIDFYADSLLLVKAFTVKYKFYTDGIKLVSIENIYDTDYQAAHIQHDFNDLQLIQFSYNNTERALKRLLQAKSRRVYYIVVIGSLQLLSINN